MRRVGLILDNKTHKRICKNDSEKPHSGIKGQPEGDSHWYQETFHRRTRPAKWNKESVNKQVKIESNADCCLISKLLS